MKRTLFLVAMISAGMQNAQAETYTDLTKAWCDDINKVIYDGHGYFQVSSGGATTVDLTIDWDNLNNYVNSNDYPGHSYLLKWDYNTADYGIADDIKDDGTAVFTGFWNNQTWYNKGEISFTDLEQYVRNGQLALTITNSNTSGVTISTSTSSDESVRLYTANNLLAANNTQLSGYQVNLNYVTAVTLHTPSSLDTTGYVPPRDYSKPFVSQVTEGKSLGRVMFLGDSITHGVRDMSYRWQFFKTLVDNDIENEIVGPRNGYHSTPVTSDYDAADASYRGVEFVNVHLAQAAGRTHNIISGSTTALVNGTNYSSGVAYDGHSTSSTAVSYDCNTWFSMMGTNDLLSDTPNSGPSPAQYVAQMQKMLGGTVAYNEATDTYSWTAGDYWGTMSDIVDDVCKEGDTFYMLSITPWGNHNNHNRDMDHYAGAEFNRNLEIWTKAYAQESGKNVVYLDITQGMVDLTSENRFMGHDAFFNTPSDRLHPNEQGSLIMAGNLARGLGISGRTAGLDRADASTTGTDWTLTNTTISLEAGGSHNLATNVFEPTNGYSVDFYALFGNGSEGDWMTTENALSITIGDGARTGTLKLSEGHIMWGDDVLFCQDNSLDANETLRITWHNGNAADNINAGYYVWLGDMLIGQGLNSSTGTFNGITLTATGGAAHISNLAYTNAAYAPVNYMPSHNNQATASGLDFTNATTTTASLTQIFTTPSTTTSVANLTSCAKWVGITNTAHRGNMNVQVTGTVEHTVFGAMSNSANKAGVMNLQVEAGAEIKNGTYNGQTAAIAGSYGDGKADAFNVYINGATIGGDIVGGAVHGNGSIDSVNIVVNDGLIKASVLGGSKTNGTVSSAEITVNGGTITGDIIAGGNAGTIGNTTVTLMGGVVQGNITKGNASRTDGARTTVTIGSEKAHVGGDITADKVIVQNVEYSGYADGFDQYSGTISAPELELSEAVLQQVTIAGITRLSAANGTNAALNAGESVAMSTVTLSNNSTLSLFKSADNHTVSTAAETTLTISQQLIITGSGNTLNANLVMQEGSILGLGGNSLQLGSSLTLGGVELDAATMAYIAQLESGESYILFSGVDELVLDSEVLTTPWSGSATVAFTNPGMADYNLYYSGAHVGGHLSIRLIPEPTTATLSLLALSGLMLRRRRK